MALDTEPREVALPAGSPEALDAAAGARRSFERLSNSAKQRLFLPVDGAKTPETRARRVAKAVATLDVAAA